MATSGNDSIEATAEDSAAEASRPQQSAHRGIFRSMAAEHRRGPRSLVNLSIYAAGLSGLWTALGTPILPIKVEEILAGTGTSLLWFDFDGDDKNGALGIVSLVGLGIAALTQPVAGVLSDRRAGPKKRMPFLMIGAAGMAAAVLFMGVVGTLLALILLNMLVQGMGNFGQGAANGLIADHVPRGQKGSAAGALNLSRVVGAGVITAIVLAMMSQYDAETATGWLTASLILLATAAIASTLWTVTSIWRNGRQSDFVSEPEPETQPEKVEEEHALPHDNYLRFLVALTVVITGFSALQLYSFFYLEDVVGLENPAQGGLVILIAISIATGLSVMPAGRLADRVGRDPMLVFAGVLGVVAAVVLIFAGSLIVVALVGAMMGVVIGIFLTVSWALANDLVSRRHAARDLGFASVAVLIGSATSRISGLAVDRLNEVQDALGYQVVLGGVAVCFVLTVALMTRLDRGRSVGSHDPLPNQPQAR